MDGLWILKSDAKIGWEFSADKKPSTTSWDFFDDFP